MRGPFARLLAAWLLAAPVGAHATEPGDSPAAALARAQIESGDFELALRTLSSRLRAGELTEAELVELYRLQGLAYLYVGDEQRARDSYERLLQAQPEFDLPASAPPKIRALFERLREDIRAQRIKPVRVTLAPAADRAEGESGPVEVAATVENLPPTARVRLYYRREGTVPFSSSDARRAGGDSFVATIPTYETPPESAPYALEYYLEVADEGQQRLAGRGDPAAPLRFQVLPLGSAAASAERAWYRSPWTWVIAGAVVAGGVTSAVLLTRPRAPALTLTIEVQ